MEGSTESSIGNARRSRFDRLVFLVSVTIVLFILLFVWRGDRIGLAATRLSPAPGTQEVTTRAEVRVTFAQPLADPRALEIQLSPPVSGTVRWEGRTAVWAPAEALSSETEYTVSIPAGIESRQGRPLLEPLNWQFTTGYPRLLFLTWDEHEHNQLHLLDPLTRAVTGLTEAPAGVLDYTVGPGGDEVVYSGLRDDGGADLYRFSLKNPEEVEHLLPCEGAVCSGPVWSPDGSRLVYERRTLTEPNVPPGPPRLWWLDSASAETVPVFEDSQWLGLGASFSPDGRWIAYISPLSQEVHAFNLQNGKTVLIPSQSGEAPSWRPDSEALLLSDIQFQGEQFAVHIFEVTLEDGAITQLTDELAVNDGTPVYSPGGQLILFGRKVARAPMGKQLWLMNLDGSDRERITHDTDIHNGLPAWSPDGKQVVIQRYAITEPGAEPGIWILDVETGVLEELATPGIQPHWVP